MAIAKRYLFLQVMVLPWLLALGCSATTDAPDRAHYSLPKSGAQTAQPTLMSSYKPSNLDGKIELSFDRSSEGRYSGGYGDVLTAIYVEEDGTARLVAIKILRPRISKPNAIGPIKKDRGPRREIRLWKLLVHPNIVPLLGLTTDFNQLDQFFSTKPIFPGMVSPWMKNGNLATYLKKHHLQTTDLLKLANILIDDNCNACLTDFGLSTLRAGLENTSYWTSTIGGAIRWRAPELLPHIDWDATIPYVPVLRTACDIFSYGQIMLQIFSGHVPYHDVTNVDCITMELFKRTEPRRPSISSSPQLIDEYWMLVKTCWGQNLDPETRPSAEGVHSIVTGLHMEALRPN
ncbi:hypothetical protein HWV62_8010 [Athelia sp. TMB]|nr:hypothetical protein HWV62_8010 [Athelia sp. TMB]